MAENCEILQQMPCAGGLYWFKVLWPAFAITIVVVLHGYIKNNRFLKYLPYLTSKIRLWKGARRLQNRQNWPGPPVFRSAQWVYWPANTTRHASRPWHCSVLLADDAYHSHVFSTARYFDPIFFSLYFYVVLASLRSCLMSPACRFGDGFMVSAVFVRRWFLQ